jgi:hypothetical protein
MWQRLDTGGTEICTLMSSATSSHWPNLLKGYVMVELGGLATDFWYNVWCDAAWQTKEVYIVPWIVPFDAKTYRGLKLRSDGGRWLAAGWNAEGPERERTERELSDVAGCIDVDLGISPSTNTLPIRRLNLEVGESRELTAAWVRFPELTVEPLAQCYTRLTERRYRYESSASGFTAELEVDDLGLVVDYQGIWRRVAESGPTEHQS